jgi:hypothetical protein
LGRSNPEKYLEWEMRVNQFFYGHNFSEEKKVRVASMEFTEYALVWWDNKNRTGERPVTWVDMKRGRCLCLLATLDNFIVNCVVLCKV